MRAAVPGGGQLLLPSGPGVGGEPFLPAVLDEEYTRHPFYGVRKMTVWLRLQHYAVGV